MRLYPAMQGRIWADLGGGGGGATTPPPPNGQSHSIKCSTTNVLRYAQAYSKELGGSSGQF